VHYGGGSVVASQALHYAELGQDRGLLVAVVEVTAPRTLPPLGVPEAATIHLLPIAYKEHSARLFKKVQSCFQRLIVYIVCRSTAVMDSALVSVCSYELDRHRLPEFWR
jgi:hypothetical protein